MNNLRAALLFAIFSVFGLGSGFSQEPAESQPAGRLAGAGGGATPPLPGERLIQPDVGGGGAMLAPKTHTVVKEDCLWNLSGHYYNDVWIWQRIYEVNVNKIEDPHWIYPGQVLIIPGIMEAVEAAPVPAEPEPEPEPEPVKKGPARPKWKPPKLSEKLPPFDRDWKPKVERLSERLPSGLTSGSSSGQAVFVPSHWREDGQIVKGGKRRFGVAGDEVWFKLAGGAGIPREGTLMTVYRKGERARDSAGTMGIYLQRVAVIRVIDASGRRCRGEVVSSSDAVMPGDILKSE